MKNDIEKLRLFIYLSSIYFSSTGAEPPSCLTPMKLAGKFFNQLSQDDFRCKAPVFNNIDAVFNEHQGRLRCTATGITKQKHIIIFLNKKAFYATLNFKRDAFL